MRSKFKQEATLTLREQRAVAEILKGNPKYLGASLAQGYGYFFLWVWFYSRSWQTQAVYQIEVPSFNHCVNTEVEPQKANLSFLWIKINLNRINSASIPLPNGVYTMFIS